MRHFISFILIATLTGCVNAFTINGGDKKGVPFYIKKGIVVQTTTYKLKWKKTVLKVTQKGKENAQFFTFYIHSNGYNNLKLIKAAENSLNNITSEIDVAQNFVAELQNTCDHDNTNCRIETNPEDSTDCTQATRVSNKTERKVVVDYSRVYFYNANIPLFSTTTASFKLGSDGTLTEGSSTVDTTKLSDMALGALPIKDVLLEKWGISSTTPQNKDRAAKEFTAEFTTLDDGGFACTYTKEYEDLSPELPVKPPLPLQGEPSYLTINSISMPKEKTAESKNTIKLNGSIKLPKAMLK